MKIVLLCSTLLLLTLISSVASAGTLNIPDSAYRYTSDESRVSANFSTIVIESGVELRRLDANMATVYVLQGAQVDVSSASMSTFYILRGASVSVDDSSMCTYYIETGGTINTDSSSLDDFNYNQDYSAPEPAAETSWIYYWNGYFYDMSKQKWFWIGNPWMADLESNAWIHLGE